MTMNNVYPIARQRHLGDLLDRLQVAGLLTWQWGYSGSSAQYTILEPGWDPRTLGTKAAEEVAARIVLQTGEVWFPVPHPGGVNQLRETEQRIAEEVQRRAEM